MHGKERLKVPLFSPVSEGGPFEVGKKVLYFPGYIFFLSKLWNWHVCLKLTWSYEIDINSYLFEIEILKLIYETDMFVFIFLFQILDGLEKCHVNKLIEGKEWKENYVLTGKQCFFPR